MLCPRAHWRRPSTSMWTECLVGGGSNFWQKVLQQQQAQTQGANSDNKWRRGGASAMPACVVPAGSADPGGWQQVQWSMQCTASVLRQGDSTSWLSMGVRAILQPVRCPVFSFTVAH